jgi:hypothetical protein
MNDPQIDELRARVDALEKQCLRIGDHLIAADKKAGAAQIVSNAFQRAVKSLGSEIAAHHGVSEVHFAERFAALCRWHYDILLRTSSDVHPEITSEIDTRTLDQIPTDDTIPRILPPPHPPE